MKAPSKSNGKRQVRRRVCKRKTVSKVVSARHLDMLGGKSSKLESSIAMDNVVNGNMPGVSWVCLPAGTSFAALAKHTMLREQSRMRACASPLVALGEASGDAWEPVVDKSVWPYIPNWIRLPRKRGVQEDLPSFSHDALFWGNNEACLLPFLPPVGRPRGRGAVIICPGGNYQYLQPLEARPVARLFAEELGVPAFVLKYRLLPAGGLAESTADLREAILQVRRYVGRASPVVTIGFSAGGHLVASGSASGSRTTPRGMPVSDAQVLVYPAIDPQDWLNSRKSGFGHEVYRTEKFRSLANGKQRILPGPQFVAPPPTFLVSSTSDNDCPPKKHSDLYAKGVLQADVPLVYMRDDFGEHGFGLQDFWTRPCLRWLQERGFGRRSQ